MNEQFNPTISAKVTHYEGEDRNCHFTLLDHFAGIALQGESESESHMADKAKRAYKQAEWMLKAREEYFKKQERPTHTSQGKRIPTKEEPRPAERKSAFLLVEELLSEHTPDNALAVVERVIKTSEGDQLYYNMLVRNMISERKDRSRLASTSTADQLYSMYGDVAKEIVIKQIERCAQSEENEWLKVMFEINEIKEQQPKQEIEPAAEMGIKPAQEVAEELHKDHGFARATEIAKAALNDCPAPEKKYWTWVVSLISGIENRKNRLIQEIGLSPAKSESYSQDVAIALTAMFGHQEAIETCEIKLTHCPKHQEQFWNNVIEEIRAIKKAEN